MKHIIVRRHIKSVKKLRIGIVGCGSVALKGHIPAWKLYNNVVVAAAADPNPVARKRCKKYVDNLYDDYKEMLDKEDLDIVDICTPPHLHFDVSLHAAERGANILVEKPMAISKNQAVEMVNRARRYGVKLCVMQNHRYIPSVMAAKRIVDSGGLGAIVGVSGQLFIPPPFGWTSSTWPFERSEGGGVVFNVAIHVIDLALWFAGDVESVFAYGGDFLGRMDIEGYFSALLKFKNKAIGVVESSWYNGGLRSTFEVRGTGGEIKIDLRNDHMLRYSSHLTPYEEVKSLLSKFLKVGLEVVRKKYFRGFLAYQAGLIGDFINSIINDAKPPVPGEEGLKSVAVAESISLSIMNNAPVQVT
ncbi:MAG: hypothetical protein DRN81_00320 [Thermoproteota archaeon]|nr:MAG: hypothetical protein DRN81_00320 [Candidatus Korarchaeota archaeon]